ncbi:MAG: T9SS type A sorting domain-containing protein [Bacteroidetes bacterium]|nr:T9SS type A sorting domain-containing protein [Bacteroidota bacterium]
MSTVAGDGRSGLVNGPGANARFMVLDGIAVDKHGNIYVSDMFYHHIRKITPDGTVSTFAGGTESGFADGTGTAARFHTPTGLAVDTLGNIYVADRDNHRIRKITPAGVVSTLAGSSTPGSGYGGGGSNDGPGNTAQFHAPLAVAVDTNGYVYVSDAINHRIRKITPAGVVSTLAGSSKGYQNGTGTAARFEQPQAITVDLNGNVYVADVVNARIRKITPAGVVTTIAGDGTEGYQDAQGTAAKFNRISGLAIDADGILYISDRRNNRIRKMSVSGQVTTLAGINYPGFFDGDTDVAMLNNPIYVALDPAGDLIIVDNYNYSVRKLGGLSAATRRAPAAHWLNATVYPNPASQVIQVILPDHGLAQVSLLDITGKVVFTSEMRQYLEIPVHELAKGMYVLHVEQSGVFASEKIILE